MGVLCYGGRSDGCGGSSGSMVIVVIFISYSDDNFSLLVSLLFL